MISTLTETEGSSQRPIPFEGSNGLTNVGRLVEEALAWKKGLCTSTYEVDNTPKTTAELFEMTKAIDQNDYQGLMKSRVWNYKDKHTYCFCRTGLETDLVGYQKMLEVVYPKGFTRVCATVTEMLHFVASHGQRARHLLSSGRRFIFVGDIGITPRTHIGLVILARRRFSFHRVHVDRMKYQPSDLFFTRYE